MRKALAWVTAMAIVVLAALAGWLYHYTTHLDAQRITDDVWMLTGFGGNVGVLRTEAGTIVVDTMTFGFQGKRIKDRAEELTGKPVVIVINTHYHQDHTHGNPAFADGTRLVATNRTRHHLLARDGGYWTGDAEAALPNETFDHTHRIAIGGKTIELVHPGRGHTDGDLIALFVEDRVLHLGDLLFNGRYPNIDLEAGGSVRLWPAALDRAATLEFDTVIPGHGPLAGHADIARFRAFLAELWEKAADAAERGWTLEETLANVALTANEGMEVFEIPFVVRFDRDFVVRRAWEEATGKVLYKEGEPSA